MSDENIPSLNRRHALGAAGGLTATVLAGCSGDDPSGEENEPEGEGNVTGGSEEQENGPERSLEAQLLDGEGQELNETVLEPETNQTVVPEIEAQNVDGEYDISVWNEDEMVAEIDAGNISNPQTVELSYQSLLPQLEVAEDYDIAISASSEDGNLTAEDSAGLRFPLAGNVNFNADIETTALPGQEGTPVEERDFETTLEARAHVDVNADVDTYRLVLEKEEGEDIELATAESEEEIQLNYEEIKEHIDEYGEQTITAEVEKNGEKIQKTQQVEIPENPGEGLFENTGELIREAMQNYHNPETSTFKVNATEPLRKVIPEAWENGFKEAGALYDLSQGSELYVDNDILDLSKRTNWTMGTEVVELENLDSETVENNFLKHLNQYEGERAWRTIEAGGRELDVHMIRYEIEDYDINGRSYWVIDEQNERVFTTGDSGADGGGYETQGLDELESAVKAAYGEVEDLAGETGLLESGLLEDYDVVNFTYGGIPGTSVLDFDKWSESDARGTFTVLSEDGTGLKEYPVRLEDGDYHIVRDTPIGEMEPQFISFEEYAEEWNGR